MTIIDILTSIVKEEHTSGFLYNPRLLWTTLKSHYSFTLQDCTYQSMLVGLSVSQEHTSVL